MEWVSFLDALRLGLTPLTEIIEKSASSMLKLLLKLR